MDVVYFTLERPIKHTHEHTRNEHKRCCTSSLSLYPNFFLSQEAQIHSETNTFRHAHTLILIEQLNIRKI